MINVLHENALIEGDKGKPFYSLNLLDDYLLYNGFKKKGLLGTIDTIFLDKNDYIGFCKKGPDFRQVGAVQVKDIVQNGPGWTSMKNHLKKDAYWTINSLYRVYPSKGPWPRFIRTNDSFKSINAIWLDLDIGRNEGKQPQQRTDLLTGLDILFRLVETQEVPKPTGIASSGRGLYCIWLLESDFLEPLPSNWSTKASVSRIHSELRKRFANLAPDLCSASVSQPMRFPGVVHGIVRKPARFFWSSTARYSIRDLNDSLGIAPVEARRKRKEPNILIPKWRQDAGRKGKRSLYLAFVSDIEAVERCRGGWQEGERNLRLFRYTTCLKNAGIPLAEAYGRVSDMASRCRPPIRIPIQTVEHVYRCKQVKFGAKSLCENFGVTADIARTLKLKCLLPPELKEEQAQAKKIQTQQKEKAQRERNDFLLFSISSNPKISCRELAKIAKENGFSISPSQTSRLKKFWLAALRDAA